MNGFLSKRVLSDSRFADPVTVEHIIALRQEIDTMGETIALMNHEIARYRDVLRKIAFTKIEDEWQQSVEFQNWAKDELLRGIYESRNC